jgi:hypothetical protein
MTIATPPDDPLARFYVYLTGDQNRAVMRACKDKNLSKSQVIRDIIDWWRLNNSEDRSLKI